MHISTAHAVSPDSGEHWAKEGVWQVAEGVHRIPLPLPMDALRAVNVYVVRADDGLTLIDGGWSIPLARDVLERGLRELGHGFGDIRRFLVTHVHRDHYTLASVLGNEFRAQVSLGLPEKPALDLLNLDPDAQPRAAPFTDALVSAGAHDLAERWAAEPQQQTDPAGWRYPHRWISGDQRIQVGTRTLDAVHTPGHTPGHYVFAEERAGLLFAGDHVLPTITPSIGFSVPPVPDPLGDFMASVTRVRSLPDLTILPAHGPVSPSSHARVDELTAHHEDRLQSSLDGLAGGPQTAYQVARTLTWTRHKRDYTELDQFSQGMAAMETKAHLDLLVARGDATRVESPEGVVFTRASSSPQPS